MKISNLKKLNKIAILGYGKEGKSSLNFLLKLGISRKKIEILDKNNQNNIEGINIISGESYLNNLDKYDVIIKSPGISPYKKELKNYYNKIITQTSIFFDNKNNTKVIGITATKGKSTTASLAFELLKKTKLNIKLVGNIGKPVLDEIDIINNNENYDFIIYELSSYMLENMKPECDIAILGNIYKCHLDWHDNSYIKYTRAKKNILEKSKYKLISSDFPNLGDKISDVQLFGTSGKYSFNQNKFYINNEVVYSGEIKLKGEHNKKNISACIGILDIINSYYYNLNIKNILNNTLNNFEGLSHRMENIGTYAGITFIDDGISTTPESTIEALKTYGTEIDTLLLGGGDYGFTNDSYIKLKKNIVKNKIKNIVLFPDTGLDIFGLNKNKYNYGDTFNININGFHINVLYTNKMYDAIKFVYKKTKTGKICIMSCAAPSYSLWSGYKEKGMDFLNNIKLLQK